MFVSKKILIIIAVVLSIVAVIYFMKRKGGKEKYSEGERLTIKNTCGVPVQIADIAFPRGDGIKCPKMKMLAPGAKVVFNDFVPYDDVVMLKSSVEPSDSFVRIGSLKRVVGKEKDIGRGCSKLMKSGSPDVYSVEPGRSSLSLCRKR